MSRGSTSLRELEKALADAPADRPLTGSELLEIVREAASATEMWEHDDYMGQDQ